MRRGSYWYAPRPNGVSHQHPFLVFDRQDCLHVPLTVYAKDAASSLSRTSAQTYLHAILPFFTYLDEDEWQIRSGHSWDAEPAHVRQAVQDYLVQHLQCKVREHRLGFQLVAITAGTPSTIRVFLASLRLYFTVMKKHGYYPFGNPLQDKFSLSPDDLADDTVGREEFPTMPEWSGVVTPKPQRARRLSDNYFKLVNDEWIPQIIDDPTLPAVILAAGELLTSWGDRERCVTRILFETGGRISEVVGLSLGDWLARGLLQEANAFSKGSQGMRVKYLRFTNDTAKLLRRYFDGERRRHDPWHRSLEDYCTLAQRSAIDLSTVPLFLSRQRTPLSAKTYREHAWNPACRAAGVDADIHQARHWHVTMAFREMYTHGPKDDQAIHKRIRELIAYMGWKNGWETVEVYQHYFKAMDYNDTQDGVHAHLDAAFIRQLSERMRRGQVRAHSRRRSAVPLSPQHPKQEQDTLPEDPEFAFLRSLGGDNA